MFLLSIQVYCLFFARMRITRVHCCVTRQSITIQTIGGRGGGGQSTQAPTPGLNSARKHPLSHPGPIFLLHPHEHMMSLPGRRLHRWHFGRAMSTNLTSFLGPKAIVYIWLQHKGAQGCSTGVSPGVQQRLSKECSTGMQHRGVAQGCTTGVQHMRAAQGCSIEVQHRGVA